MTEPSDRHDGTFHASLDVLRSMIGHRITRVVYKGAVHVSQEVGRDAHAIVHEVDQAVIFSTALTTIVLEWRICNYDEFLGVVVAPGEAATISIYDARDVTNLGPWNSLLGSTVAGFGVAMQSTAEENELLWALRMDFVNGASAVVALGELREMMPNYQPDNLLVIFDREVSQSYQVLGAAESAWGRDLHL